MKLSIPLDHVNNRPSVAKTMRSRIKLYVLLAAIWFVITLPLPWLIGNENVTEDSFYTILGIIGVMSIPFVMLGIVWTVKPELAS